jgi:DNA-binding beta-propeller fold protein YncE
MRVGPNGNLYICSYLGGFVLEVNASNGAPVSNWSLPPGALANDIAFLPNGEILVTAMRTNLVYRYDGAHNLLGTFSDPNWGNPHGIVLSPSTGNILVSDGVMAEVTEFDPVTFAELNANFLQPPPGDKIVDLEFKPASGPVSVQPMNWGSVKQLFR